MSSNLLARAAPASGDALCTRQRRLNSLIARVGDGDRDAFSALYDELVQSVYVLCLSEGQEPSLAAQLTLDVFLKAWQQACAYDPQAESAWDWVRSITFETLNGGLGTCAVRSHQTGRPA